MLKVIRVSAMLLVLLGSANAGEMLTPPAPTPPPPMPALAVQEPTFNDEISTPGVSESLTEIALELLAVLPSLF